MKGEAKKKKGAIKGKISEIVLFDAVLLWQTAFCLLVLTTNSNVAAGKSIQISISSIPVVNSCPPRPPPEPVLP